MLSFGINIKTKNKMAAKNSVTDAVAGTIKPPISFKEFAKEPVKGLLFIVIIAIGYLYVDGKVNYNSQIEKQGQKIEVLESKVDALTNQLRKSDSALSAAVSKITVLQELGKIN
jgi:outer membrane murein-binding lipoprotein Lpp